MGAPARLRQPVEIQHSEASLRALAKRHGINQKTVGRQKKPTVSGEPAVYPFSPAECASSLSYAGYASA